MDIQDLSVRKQIIALKNQIVAGFTASNWRELGVLTGQQAIIDGHPRLLRSLSFNDDDYEGNVLSVLQRLITSDENCLEVIAHFVREICPEAGEFISSDDTGSRRIVFSPLAFRVPDNAVDYSLVSVMMPFSGELKPVYEAMQNAAKLQGLACRRADDIWDDSTVIQDVFNLLFTSYIVVCDFTGKNPNVFYEAGIAHTLGKHVIPITQSADDIPFDLRHHRFVRYLNNNEGRERLAEELSQRFKTLVERSKAIPWK